MSDISAKTATLVGSFATLHGVDKIAIVMISRISTVLIKYLKYRNNICYLETLPTLNALCLSLSSVYEPISGFFHVMCSGSYYLYSCTL